MPNTSSAKKRVRQNVKRRALNHWRKRSVKTQVRTFLKALQDHDVVTAETEFRKVTGVHGWVTGLYDGRIRIPVKDFGTAEREIRGTTQLALSGTKILGHWKDKDTGNIYAFAELDLEILDETLATAADLHQEFQEFYSTNGDAGFDRFVEEDLQ